MSQNSKNGNDNKKNQLLNKIEEENADIQGSAEQLLREMQDEIAPEATPLWTFVNDNAPKIALVVVSLVILISGFAFYQWKQESSLEDAKLQLAIVNSDSDNNSRLAKLEEFKVSAPSQLQIAIELEIARTALLLNDLPKAENSYLTIKNIENNSPLGLNIAVDLADTYAKQGQAQKALDVYNEIVTQFGTDQQVAIYASIGDIAASANMNEKAKEAYQKAYDLLPEGVKDSANADYLRKKIN